ncbi:hypothetical protein AK812_SmicGene27588, partial [Symbiodinium microadriaticum]
ALFHCLVSKFFKNGTKMGKTILTAHVLAMTTLFTDSHSKGQMSGASLFASVCFFSILAACKAMEELRARCRGGSQTSSHDRDPSIGRFQEIGVSLCELSFA